MSLNSIGWLFIAGVLLHNMEEALFLPQWSAHAGRWRPRVGAAEVRVAAGALSVGLLPIAIFGSLWPARSWAAYCMAGVALAMVLNALVPHLLVTFIMRRYMPGTASAVLFNLPLGLLYLHRALAQGRIEARRFVWFAPLTVLLLAAAPPTLLALGRLVTGPPAKPQGTDPASGGMH